MTDGGDDLARAKNRATETVIESRGFPVAGSAERPHRDPRFAYRVVWIDR